MIYIIKIIDLIFFNISISVINYPNIKKIITQAL